MKHQTKNAITASNANAMTKSATQYVTLFALFIKNIQKEILIYSCKVLYGMRYGLRTMNDELKNNAASLADGPFLKCAVPLYIASKTYCMYT